MVRQRSVAPMRAAKAGYIVMSLIFCVFGIALIAFPRISASVLCAMAGAIMIAFGVIKLIGYFSKDLFRLAFQYDLAFGILLIALGVIVLLKTDNVMNFTCIVLGIFILADGLFKIQIALDAKKFGIRLWWLILSLAVITGIVGLLLVFRPTQSLEVLCILLGISLLTEGILSLSTVLTAVKIIRHQMPDNMEAECCGEYYERKDW